MRRIFCIIGWVWLLPAAFAVSSNHEVDLALEALRNPDPQVRSGAVKQIESMGSLARPALVKAAQSHDRLIAGQAAELLMKLPFHREGDTETVRALLGDYHLQPAEQRQQIIIGTVIRSGEAAMLLCRLINEDPDEQVAWAIGDLYAGQPDSFWNPLMNCDLQSARNPVRATVARGLFFKDRQKARELFKQVLIEEEQYPSAPTEKLQEIYLLLSADAQVNGRLADALHYRRLIESLPPAVAVDADGEPLPRPSPLTTLLAFYAGVGVIPGFGEDLADSWEEIPQPVNLYGLSRVFSCPGLSPVSVALERMGDLSLPQDVDQRIEIGNTAYENQWASIGIRILEQAAKEAQAPVADRANLARRLQCLSSLYLIAKETGDDAAAIRYSSASLESVREMQIEASSRELEGRLLGHQIQIARAKGDKTAMKPVVDAAVKLLDAGGLDADSGAALVNALLELGDKGRAEAIFQRLFQQHQDIVTRSDDFPMALNNLAWLCAGVGMKLDVAVDASERAIRARPAEYSSIDTAALANFRAGNVSRAIELETFALALHPNDQFLIRQLRMFRSGKMSQ